MRKMVELKKMKNMKDIMDLRMRTGWCKDLVATQPGPGTPRHGSDSAWPGPGLKSDPDYL